MRVYATACEDFPRRQISLIAAALDDRLCLGSFMPAFGNSRGYIDRSNHVEAVLRFAKLRKGGLYARVRRRTRWGVS